MVSTIALCVHHNYMLHYKSMQLYVFADLETHEMLAAAEDFYRNLGTMAREKRYHIIILVP